MDRKGAVIDSKPMLALYSTQMTVGFASISFPKNQ
jgi:hypothetical protein